MNSNPNQEIERDIEVKVTVPTFGTQAQRYKTAQRIKEILEIKLHVDIDTEIKHGKEWHPVERLVFRGVE